MAPRTNIELQTFDIINNLFEDLDDLASYKSGPCYIETDGAGDDAFDPVLIADKLRELGDDYDEKIIQPLMGKLKQAELQKIATDQVVAVFGEAVEELCKSPVGKGAEVAPEMQLLKASVALGMYIRKKSPDLVDAVKNAMPTFINSRLGGWLETQGGWDRVTSA